VSPTTITGTVWNPVQLVRQSSARRPARARPLKRDVVAETIVGRCAGRLCIVGLAIGRTVQHDKLAVEGLQHDFSGETLLVALVSPLAGLQRPFDVDFAALVKV